MTDNESRRSRRRRPLRKGIYLLPSLLTTGNLFAGYYSVVAALHGEYRAAAMALGVAFVLDGLDGRLARLTNTQSDFGQAYDSLADVIAFGAAPAVLVLSWGLWDLGRVGWLASFFYLVCAAMRLARFSLHAGVDRRYFIGYPSPASAGLLAALAFYFPARVESMLGARALLAVVLACAVLMISRFRYRSFKDVNLRRRQPAIVVVLLATVIALIALDPENVLLLLSIGYILSGPTEKLWHRIARREAESRSGGGTTADSEGHP